jgi:sarcosine oxidase subunit beta
VNAAGAWAGSVGELARVQIPVSPSPRFQIVAQAPPGLPPTTPFLIDLETGAHMRVHNGNVIAGVRPDLPSVGFDLQTGDEAASQTAARASTRFPALRQARMSGFVSGLYEMTPDGLPLAGMVQSLPGYYVVAGFNGHGIMHGPPVAEAIAEVMVKGHSDTFDLSRLAPQRFDSATTSARRVSSLF